MIKDYFMVSIINYIKINILAYNTFEVNFKRFVFII